MKMDTKEIFSIRKFKTGTHSARLGKVALASAAALTVALASPSVLADEYTNTPEVTTVTSEQPTVDLNVENLTIDEAVDNARSVGVEVEVLTEEEVVDSQAEAQAHLDAQKDRVIEATETQLTINDTLSEAKKAAQEAGVELEEEESVVYKDDNEAALADAKVQASQLEEATQAQTEINESLSAAIQEARDKGVKVVIEEGVKTKDVKEALNDLAEQLAVLEATKNAQVDLDVMIAHALEEAEKAGIIITLSPRVTTRDIQAALDEVNARLDKLTEDIRLRDEANKAIMTAVKEAQSAGVKVTKTDEQVFDSVEKAQAETDKLVKLIKEATKAQQEVDSLLAEAQKLAAEKETKVVIKGTNVVSAEQAITEAKKQVDLVKAIVTENVTARDTYAKDYADWQAEVKRLEDEHAKAVANIKAIHDKNRKVFEAKGLTYTEDYAKDKATVDKWNAENSGEKISSTQETGLTATAKTTFSGVSNATKVTSNIAANAIQGRLRTENLDAKFDNIFRIGSGRGTTSTIRVSNTSHGDVLLTFSNIVEAPESGHYDNYVALWAAEDGGIAYGVFISAGAGTSWGGGPESGGGSGAGGYLAERQGWVKSVDVTVETVSSDLTEFTANDIDNGQKLIFTSINGAKVTLGKNVSQSGNTFTGTIGDVSQGSKGVLDSNGLGLSYENPTKIKLSYTHWTLPDTAFSIVGGLFGQSSQKVVKEYIPPIGIEEVPAEPQLVLPPEPDKPHIKSAEIETVQVAAAYHPVNLSATITPTTFEVTAHDVTIVVPVHDVKVATSVNPVTVREEPAQPTLPNTGETDSAAMSMVGGLMLSVLGLVGVRKRQEN